MKAAQLLKTLGSKATNSQVSYIAAQDIGWEFNYDSKGNNIDCVDCLKCTGCCGCTDCIKCEHCTLCNSCINCYEVESEENYVEV